MSSSEDTIAAIATPIGQAGIGIIRISGPQSLKIAKTVFTPKTDQPLFKSHQLYMGYIRDPESTHIIDETLVSFMAAPNSYTREDVFEINSHSGYALLSKIMAILMNLGARMAEPGEFTKRAFLNGRIDLSQAEAVVDLMNAQSERGLVLASQQVRGSIKTGTEALREKTIHILANAEAAIDFPEDDLEHLFRGEGAESIENNLVQPIQTLIKAHADRLWVDGINTAIVGRVNAGKSSLLNRLLDEPRAIVTDIPGTTRDVIESTFSISGIPLHIVDTAGLREVKGEVERQGVHLTRQKIHEADLLLIIIDRSRPLNKDDMDILAQCRKKKALVVINKMDLPMAPGYGEKADDFLNCFPTVEISALTGQGLDRLKEAIRNSILSDNSLAATTSHAVPNLRHRKVLKAAKKCFENADIKARTDAPMEIVAFELRTGLALLGEITGQTLNDEVMDSVFSQFCLGK